MTTPTPEQWARLVGAIEQIQDRQNAMLKAAVVVTSTIADLVQMLAEDKS